MRINVLTTSFADIGRLLSSVEGCGVTPPKTLTAVLQAHAKLTQAPAVPNPVKKLVAGALDGRNIDVNKMLEQTALGRLVNQEHLGLAQAVEPELLAAFGKRCDEDGGA